MRRSLTLVVVASVLGLPGFVASQGCTCSVEAVLGTASAIKETASSEGNRALEQAQPSGVPAAGAPGLGTEAPTDPGDAMALWRETWGAVWTDANRAFMSAWNPALSAFNAAGAAAATDTEPVARTVLGPVASALREAGISTQGNGCRDLPRPPEELNRAYSSGGSDLWIDECRWMGPPYGSPGPRRSSGEASALPPEASTPIASAPHAASSEVATGELSALRAASDGGAPPRASPLPRAHVASPPTGIPQDPPLLAAIAAVAALASLLAVLYRRLSRDDALSNPTRARVYAFIQTHPGATLGAIARALRLDRRTVMHHVGVLRDFDLVASAAVGARTRYYGNGGAHTDLEKRMHVALESRKARAVVAFIVRRPGASTAEVAHATGLPWSTAAWHRARLERLGATSAGRVAPEALDAVLADAASM